MPRITGEITINGVKYPVENFTINWDNDLQAFGLNGDNTFHLYLAETEEQRDKRLNPRKYDSCKFCDHVRYRHEGGYGKCNGVSFDDYDETECDCKEFV